MEAFELLAIMDIRARSISFASQPRRPEGPPDHERAKDGREPTETARPLRCDALVLSMLGFRPPVPPASRQSKSLTQHLRQLGEVHRHPPRLVTRQPIWPPSGATQRYVRNRGEAEVRGLRLKRR